MKSGDQQLQQWYEELLGSTEVRLNPISSPILREAARLRAHLPALRTPDAVHAATGRLAACALFLTNDTGFRQVPNLPVCVLKDLTGG